MLNQFTLATAQLRVGARDEGVRTGYQALAAAATCCSARVRIWSADMADAASVYAGYPDADDLRARAAAFTAG